MGSIYQSIEILSKEKGIDSQIILDAVKDAMMVAARKHFKTAEDMAADFDSAGALKIAIVKRVVETVEDPLNELSVAQARAHNPAAEAGSEVRFPVATDVLGRIAAQTAKQVILQKVREAERETVFGEYSDRVGELVRCMVRRSEGPDLVVELPSKIEARLPKREQSRLESFSASDQIWCVIKGVEKAGKYAGVVVSRGAPELVMRLFERDVPEIYDGTVVIRACAREAGERTKIAVLSNDRDVDAVGACVGMKGMRVQGIIRELRGEKIDIIEYSEDPVGFATHALSPAKITRVSIVSAEERRMEVIVDDTQLSLAIGKKGQNVRLAAKLLDWKIDIKSEEEKRQEVEAQMAAMAVSGAPVSVLVDYGMPEALTENLLAAGITTVEKLGSMTPEQLEEIPGSGPETVQEMVAAINAYYGQYETAPAEDAWVEPEATSETVAELAVEPDTETAGEQAGERRGEPLTEAEGPTVEAAEAGESTPEAVVSEDETRPESDTMKNADE